MSKLYGVFSADQAEVLGVLEYRRPDGSVVQVTEVSPSPGAPNNMYPDKQDVGEVVAYVRKIRGPSRCVDIGYGWAAFTKCRVAFSPKRAVSTGATA